jgi:hypothetical protein
MRSDWVSNGRRTVGLALLVATMGLGRATLTQAQAVWTAEVVDAETGQPLEGVVVLAVWHRRHTGPGGWGGGWTHEATEVVTGADGRFEIPAPSPGVTLFAFEMAPPQPAFLLFKPGYGPWRFRGERTWPSLSPQEREARRDLAWEQFAEDGVVLELSPLRTREERLQGVPTLPEEVPEARMPRLLDAITQERLRLSLPPAP